MTWRFRCNMRFSPGSGMAAWAKAQLDVRLTHDYDPHRQQLNEEASYVVVQGDTLAADLFLASESLAQDTFATMTVGSVTAWLLPDGTKYREKSFVHIHDCTHGLDTPTPCPPPETRWPAE